MRIDNTNFQYFIEGTQSIPLVSTLTGAVRVIVNGFAAVHNLAMAVLFRNDMTSERDRAIAGKHFFMLKLNALEIKRGIIQLLPIIGAVWLEKFNQRSWNEEQRELCRSITLCETKITNTGSWLGLIKTAWNLWWMK